MRDLLHKRIELRARQEEVYAKTLEETILPVLNAVLEKPLDELIEVVPGYGCDSHVCLKLDDERWPVVFTEKLDEAERILPELDSLGIENAPTMVLVCQYRVINSVDAALSLPYDLVKVHQPLAERYQAAKALAEHRTFSEENLRQSLDSFLDLIRKTLEKAHRERELEEQKRKTVEAFIAEHGRDDQRERLAERLLPDSEALDSLRDWVFHPLEGVARFQRIEPADVCRCAYPDPDTVYFESGEATEATNEQYEALKAIRKAVLPTHPDAKIVLRYHRGECDECDETRTLYSVHVEIKYGPFRLSREYACPQPELTD